MDEAGASNNNTNEENRTVGAASTAGAADAAGATACAVVEASGTVGTIILYKAGASNDQDASNTSGGNTDAKIYYL